MKQFILILTLLIIMPNIAYANLVRVSDYTVNQFYNKYNDTAKNVTKNNVIAVDPPMFIQENDNYNNYMMFCSRYSCSSIVILRVNKEGHVSAISLIIPFNSQLSVDVGTATLRNIISVLGLSDDLGKSMVLDIANGVNPAYRYCYATRRYIFMTSQFDQSAQINNITLYAMAK